MRRFISITLFFPSSFIPYTRRSICLAQRSKIRLPSLLFYAILVFNGWAAVLRPLETNTHLALRLDVGNGVIFSKKMHSVDHILSKIPSF